MTDTVNDFIAKIEEEFEDIPKGSLKPESAFRENFDWSSVNALILFSMINIEYDIIMTVEDLQSATTVQELYDVVVKKSK